MGRLTANAGRRKSKRRNQRKRFLIACEGEKEVAYFRWLNKHLGSDVILKPVRHWSAPERVLERALQERENDRKAADESGDTKDVYDGVWIVVDVDEHANLAKTLIDADKTGICSAVSGPCFEVWLILHEKDHSAAFTNSKAVKKCWADITGRYRTWEQEFDHMAGHLSIAIGHAEALLARCERDRTPRHKRNPATEIGTLVQSIADTANIDISSL